MIAVRTYLKRLVEVTDFAELVQESVDLRLVVLHEWVKGNHVRFLGIRGFVRQVLQHLRDL